MPNKLTDWLNEYFFVWMMLIISPLGLVIAFDNNLGWPGFSFWLLFNGIFIPGAISICIDSVRGR